MEQSTINQRLKFLVGSLAKSSREFSLAINESPTNTSNYTGNRGTEPRAEYLTKVLLHFGDINARWLMTGEGEPFLAGTVEQHRIYQPAQNNSFSQVIGQVGRDAITRNHGIPPGASPSASSDELAAAKREIEFLKTQMASQQHIIESKDEIIQLLKSSMSKP